METKTTFKMPVRLWKVCLNQFKWNEEMLERIQSKFNYVIVYKAEKTP